MSRYCGDQDMMRTFLTGVLRKLCPASARRLLLPERVQLSEELLSDSLWWIIKKLPYLV